MLKNKQSEILILSNIVVFYYCFGLSVLLSVNSNVPQAICLSVYDIFVIKYEVCNINSSFRRTLKQIYIHYDQWGKIIRHISITLCYFRCIEIDINH